MSLLIVMLMLIEAEPQVKTKPLVEFSELWYKIDRLGDFEAVSFELIAVPRTVLLGFLNESKKLVYIANFVFPCISSFLL